MKRIKFIILTLLLSVAVMAQNNEAKVDIKVSTRCGMCEQRIEKKLAFEKGITAVDVDYKAQVAHVTYDASKTDVPAIRTAISNIGYDADEVPANPKAYAKLPACCRKDAAPHD